MTRRFCDECGKEYMGFTGLIFEFDSKRKQNDGRDCAWRGVLDVSVVELSSQMKNKVTGDFHLCEHCVRKAIKEHFMNG